jgi:hypothetical protein
MKRAARFACVLGVFALLAARTSVAIQANGAEFFEAENDGKIVLYYFGNVKDSKGNVVDKVMVTITAKNANLTFPFRNDAPGHFRSPDIGKSIQGAGKTVDPAQIEIIISKPGYKLVKSPKIPNKMGAVQLDTFVLDPVGAPGK